MPERSDPDLSDHIAAAVAAAIARHAERFPPDTRPVVAVAYSGGVDSTALLHGVARCAPRGTFDAFAFHVNHGLAADADAWAAHCRDEAQRLGVAYDDVRVDVDPRAGSLEAEARRLRYDALVRLCMRHGCAILVTAHHADDQAETVLLNLLRGAGIGGLTAIARTRWLDDVLLLRPLLDVPRDVLRAAIESQGLAVVEDPSNEDRRFTRNALRHEVMPVLRRIVPTVAARLAQTAAHAVAAQTLLDEIGREDLAAMVEASSDIDDGLDVDRLRALSDVRAANALRVWLARHGLRPPSAASLREMLAQLRSSTPGPQLSLLHESRNLRIYRGRVSIEAVTGARPGIESLEWRGEPVLASKMWGGRLCFAPTGGEGFDASALRAGPLTLRGRQGGERMRVAADRPSRTLKNLYQERAIPSWRRERLPLVYLGEQLILVAGIGPNAAALRPAVAGGDRVELTWHGVDG